MRIKRVKIKNIYNNKRPIVQVILYNRIISYSYILSLQCNRITSMKSKKRKKIYNNLNIQN